MSTFQEEMAKMQAPKATTETATVAAVAKRRKPKKKKASNIASNPYHAIISNEPSQAKQRDQFIELMTFKDAATAKINEKALVEYSAWMQEQRQEMSSELITLNDTGTFSNLQLVLQDINGDLLDFEDRIKPFLDIIGAVRALQEKDLITDTIDEINKQKGLVESLEAEIYKVKTQNSSVTYTLADIEQDIKYEKKDISMYAKQRSWFGMGNITDSAQARIDECNVDIGKLNIKLSEGLAKGKKFDAAIVGLLKELETAQSFGEMAEEKKILADMLNLNSNEHGVKHSELIASATKFVSTTKERVGETLDSSLGLSDHIGKLSDLSYNIRGRYSVLASAAEEAEKNNAATQSGLKKDAEGIDASDQLGKLENEEQLRDIAKYVNSLNDSVADTAMVLTDMTVASQRIETMQHANNAQIKKTRSIATSGIAGVADNLSSVLTSIGQTAIGQAATAAEQSLRRMNTTTIGLTKEQMLNQAKDRQDVNSELARNLENLAGFGEVIELANQNTYDAVAEARELVSELRETADNVKDTIAEGVEIASSVVNDTLV